MLQRGKFSKKCGRLGGEWEANWVAEGGWEASWAPLGSILSTGRWSRDVCTIVKEVITPHAVSRNTISRSVQELGVENVPGPEIEEPYQFGYFYSYCGKASWRDTGVRSGALLCCRVGGL